jgi:hypothetical protein
MKAGLFQTVLLGQVLLVGARLDAKSRGVLEQAPVPSSTISQPPSSPR